MNTNNFSRKKRIIDDFDSSQSEENEYFYHSDSDTLGFSYDSSNNTKVVINLRQIKLHRRKKFKNCKINLSSEFNELNLKQQNRLPFSHWKDNEKDKKICSIKEVIEEQNFSNDKTSNCSISKENNGIKKNVPSCLDILAKIKRPRSEKSYNNLLNQYCKPSKLELIKIIKGYRMDGLIGVKRRELLKILTSKAPI